MTHADTPPRKGTKGMPATAPLAQMFPQKLLFSKKTHYICRSRRKQSSGLMQHSETHRKRTRIDIDFQHITSTLKTRLVWSEKKTSSECKGKPCLKDKEALFAKRTISACHTRRPPRRGKASAAAEEKPTFASGTAPSTSDFRKSNKTKKQKTT